MCGITGYFTPWWGLNEEDMRTILTRMTHSIKSRGPDDHGLWVDASAGVALGHRRLAILDLSDAGHQPMVSSTGRYVTVFNGEIYNHLSLRNEIEALNAGIEWRGHSDTETLLAAIELWGFEETLKRCIGMFAIAVWDRKERELFLARDRMGEKPLYFGWQGEGSKAVFFFASELKALKQFPTFKDTVNRDALTLFLRHNYVPAPYTIYHGIHKLIPGTMLCLSERKREPQIKAFWSMSQVALNGAANRMERSKDTVLDELEHLLRSAVKQQMVADVPLGAFLSGGIDSSTIVALMQQQSSRPVRTFSIGFHEEAFNEAEHAKAVANCLGTEHTELYVTPKEAIDIIPYLPKYYDEPFADSSQIPTFLISQMARQHVTVALSGDAGDELFCGYNRYLFSSYVWKKISPVPMMIRTMAARGIKLFSPDWWNALSKYLPVNRQRGRLGDMLHKGADILPSSDMNQLYMGLISYCMDPSALVLNGKEPPTFLTGFSPPLDALNPIERMMALDTMGYLADDILVKVDRAAMAVSLEVRVPLLDHRVVEFAWGMPMDFKLRNGVTKWALRQVLYKYVPESLINRPKMGFGIPLEQWLRGSLREWAEDLLDADRLHREGYLKPEPIRTLWNEHLSGRRNWAQHLWGVLMFQSWLEEQKN
ncbi:asparagine synthase (glutamine-hydrolyzing) [Legionella shakespearei]|uniref:asparagine synthase (glutamine-hydrolyzing) n=1 Tax=Legionella shakespearei DSM 23087 TaxID=1122169 RepID=A0A0W0YV23_9GAMM|nr:asparagine synthase (glutamine-hydrolyzing) [Legionella shakespearei]KTD60733.1 asparagine synthetase, glutamine-hydrolyzing [Legionella shakespearei DSM 23087]